MASKKITHQPQKKAAIARLRKAFNMLDSVSDYLYNDVYEDLEYLGIKSVAKKKIEKLADEIMDAAEALTRITAPSDAFENWDPPNWAGQANLVTKK